MVNQFPTLEEIVKQNIDRAYNVDYPLHRIEQWIKYGIIFIDLPDNKIYIRADNIKDEIKNWNEIIKSDRASE